jgi:hypothetical protein
MSLRSIAAALALALCLPLCFAQNDPYAKATVANSSASFLDVSACLKLSVGKPAAPTQISPRRPPAA